MGDELFGFFPGFRTGVMITFPTELNDMVIFDLHGIKRLIWFLIVTNKNDRGFTCDKVFARVGADAMAKEFTFCSEF